MIIFNCKTGWYFVKSDFCVYIKDKFGYFILDNIKSNNFCGDLLLKHLQFNFCKNGLIFFFWWNYHQPNYLYIFL